MLRRCEPPTSRKFWDIREEFFLGNDTGRVCGRMIGNSEMMPDRASRTDHSLCFIRECSSPPQERPTATSCHAMWRINLIASCENQDDGVKSEAKLLRQRVVANCHGPAL